MKSCDNNCNDDSNALINKINNERNKYGTNKYYKTKALGKSKDKKGANKSQTRGGATNERKLIQLNRYLFIYLLIDVSVPSSGHLQYL